MIILSILLVNCVKKINQNFKEKIYCLKILNPRFDAIYTDSTKSLIISKKINKFY